MKKKEIFFSQHGEDYLLWRLFRRKKQGYFVEVGALDGIRFSNSYLFEQHGWSGICVEPHPGFYGKLKENRQGSFCIQAAAGSKEGQLPFFAEPKGEFSTLLRENTQKESLRNKMAGYKEILVDVFPLDAILNNQSAPTSIDFISIDVEGAEPEVLAGLSLETYSPRCLVIEANGEKMNKIIDSFMSTNGYHKAGRLSKTNNFYCRKIIDAIRLAIIPIRCVVRNSEHDSQPTQPLDDPSRNKEIRMPCLFVMSLQQFVYRVIRRINSIFSDKSSE